MHIKALESSGSSDLLRTTLAQRSFNWRAGQWVKGRATRASRAAISSALIKPSHTLLSNALFYMCPPSALSHPPKKFRTSGIKRRPCPKGPEDKAPAQRVDGSCNCPLVILPKTRCTMPRPCYLPCGSDDSWRRGGSDSDGPRLGGRSSRKPLSLSYRCGGLREVG